MQFFRDSQVPCLGLPVRLCRFPSAEENRKPKFAMGSPSVRSLPLSLLPSYSYLRSAFMSLAVARPLPASLGRSQRRN